MSVQVTNRTSTSISVSTTYTGYELYSWYLDANPRGQTTSPSYTFSNLTPNTSYYIECYCVLNGTWTRAGSVTASTLPEPTPTPPNPPWHSPYIDYRVEGGYNLYWPSSSGATLYRLRVRRGYDNYTTTYTTSSTSYTVTGLQYGVTYHVSVRAENAHGSSSYTVESAATVAPRTPSISGNSTVNSITINISGMSGNYDEVVVERYTANNVFIDSKTASSGTSQLTWTGLTVGQIFNFRARSRYFINDVWLESVGVGQTQVEVGAGRPDNFSWTIPKESGGQFNLTALEWNSFTARINEFRQYKGLGNYSFTQAYPNNNFTANIFNEARTAIQQMNPPTPVPSAAQKDGIVYASLLNSIVTSLNSIP